MCVNTAGKRAALLGQMGGAGDRHGHDTETTGSAESGRLSRVTLQLLEGSAGGGTKETVYEKQPHIPSLTPQTKEQWSRCEPNKEPSSPASSSSAPRNHHVALDRWLPSVRIS